MSRVVEALSLYMWILRALIGWMEVLVRWAVTVRVVLPSWGQGLNVRLLSGYNSRTVTSRYSHQHGDWWGWRYRWYHETLKGNASCWQRFRIWREYEEKKPSTNQKNQAWTIIMRFLRGQNEKDRFRRRPDVKGQTKRTEQWRRN